MDEFKPSERNKVKRVPKRGHYDKKTIYEILDATFICHLGFSMPNGQPFVIPTAYGREGDRIYVHGSSKSRTMVATKEGIPVCLTVTHLDGIVLARSAFHHSMNYRSAVVFGKAKEVLGEEKEKALLVISENILKDRWDESRLPNKQELKATAVLAIEIEEASAKIRDAGPSDEKADYELPIWAGVVPMKTVYETPWADPVLPETIPVPNSVSALFTEK